MSAHRTSIYSFKERKINSTHHVKPVHPILSLSLKLEKTLKIVNCSRDHRSVARIEFPKDKIFRSATTLQKATGYIQRSVTREKEIGVTVLRMRVDLPKYRLTTYSDLVFRENRRIVCRYICFVS